MDLFGEKPLGIFTNVAELKDSPDILKTWSMLQARELKLSVTHPPSNYFQKIALWTEQGKLWQFPINNEQGTYRTEVSVGIVNFWFYIYITGLDDEAKVYFTDHVFLDNHLESWCPAKGPIRHFMELVCVGLSKNPYFTVAQKIEHIEWFRNYFEEKKDILQKVIVHQSQSDKTQEVEK